MDVMERSPNLPLHFADENLEPSASCGLNALAEHIAVAMERSTSPNTGSKNTKTGCKSGAQQIETAPRNGGFLILEEDTSGKNDIARWASEAGGWVRENGEPIKITPSYWYPIKGENYLQHGLDISISPPPGERTAPEQRFVSDIITSRSDAAPPETVATAKIDATAVEPRRASRARNRFAAFSIAASLVVAVWRRHAGSAAILVAGTRPCRRTDSRTGHGSPRPRDRGCAVEQGHRGSGSA